MNTIVNSLIVVVVMFIAICTFVGLIELGLYVMIPEPTHIFSKPKVYDFRFVFGISIILTTIIGFLMLFLEVKNEDTEKS